MKKQRVKHMKRVLLRLFLIVAVLLSAVSAGYYFIVRPRLPEWTVVQMMDQLDQVGLEDLGFRDELSDVEEELFSHLLELVIENLDYEMIDSRIEGQLAYVTVNLETVDTPRLITDNVDIIMSNALSNLDSLFLSVLGGNMEEAIMQEFINLLADDALTIVMTTQEVEIPLERSGFFWVPIITDEFLLTIIGLDAFTLRLLDQIMN